ncbi:MAG: ABC transporter permease subunit [Verrucomicrobia bacterium]|nr:ABC transporter permease subunit [Verrucomicrobiota bacterium]
MNAFVRKEVRLLLPGFLLALALAGMSCFLPHGTNDALLTIRSLLVLGLCPAAAVALALDSFGGEFSAHTFGHLLSQPVSRARVWWTKSLLLLVAFGLVLVVWCLSLLLTMPPEQPLPGTRAILLTSALVGLSAYSGALWTALLFRQVTVAFWFTVLVPAGLVMVVLRLTKAYPEGGDSILIGVFAVYAVTGFFWAKHLFLRAQDVQWIGRLITMPEVPGLRALRAGRNERRRFRPQAALLAKEFQLHQSQLVIAGGLALLHLAVIVARTLEEGFRGSPVLALFADHFWVLWLVMAMLVGCAAVAEERRFGTLEAQLCLPVKRRTQLRTKFSVALLLSLPLGVVMPLLFEGDRVHSQIGLNIKGETDSYDIHLPGVGASFEALFNGLHAVAPAVSGLALLVMVIAVVAIAFYASTLTRSMLQAAGLAMLGFFVAAVLANFASRMGALVPRPPWRGWLIFLVGVPGLALTLAWLASWNFKRLRVGWPMWWRNAVGVLGSFACVIVATTAIYHRVWELVTPLEGPHGPARLTSTQGVTLRSSGNTTLVAQLPGGRVWSDRFRPMLPSWRAILTGEKMTGSYFRSLEGSNWTSVAMFFREVAATKNDGSLWVSGTPDDHTTFWPPSPAAGAGLVRMVRVGSDNDWKSVAGDHLPAFLLKTNGTLWRLGTNHIDDRKPWPGLRAFTPERLGTDSDWAELAVGEPPAIEFRKADGRTWLPYNPGGLKRDEPGVLRLDDQSSLRRTPQWDDAGWRSRSMTAVPGRRVIQLGVREDGTFRVCREWQRGAKEWTKLDVQLRNESNWLGLVCTDYLVVTLKADGTLWKWDFPDDPVVRPATARATRFSSHSDWVAICPYGEGMAGLAADGGLWFWAYEARHFYPSQFAIQPLLAASRKPQLIANVLSKLE